jgi:hypothetical protein
MRYTRTLALLASALLLLSGCGLTPTQKKWAGIAVGVLAAGAVIAHEQDSGKVVAPNTPTPGVNCVQAPEMCQ